MSDMQEIAGDVHIEWGIRIPLRDGVRLNATLYLPTEHGKPCPAVFTLTPYISQSYHDIGLSFAAHGYPFLTVDVRGRGNSEGEFLPLFNEAKDGHDIVEWLAKQPYCNGQVAMWGGSYAGNDQWATARESPPHLATIVPVASPYVGVDFPMAHNISYPYTMQWLTLTWGHTSQEKIFAGTDHFWGKKYRSFQESGRPFRELDTYFGSASRTFQLWMEHPRQDEYWDSYNPTPAQYAKIAMPVLTITGHYDGDQPGALMHYREHLKHAGAKANHYLVMGPWDHAGTRTPQAEFVGLKFAPQSVVDLLKLHRDWFKWTMEGGAKPEFLEKKVAYYVMDAEKWRYADTLDGITARTEPLFLHSHGNPTDVFRSGSLETGAPGKSGPDHYVYDPRDMSLAGLESTIDTESRADSRMVHAATGKQLVYHSAPFENDTEVSGFFRLTAWIAIDTPDTDFSASVYDVAIDGSSVLLTRQYVRARYRESLRKETLVQTTEPLRYEFDRFMFVSRRIKKGNRLRLVFGPLNSIYSQKNYNSGGAVADETIKDARAVTVRLFHDEAHPSVLYVPVGHPE